MPEFAEVSATAGKVQENSRMSYARLLVIQLDSMPWSVLHPLFDEGALPRLKALYETGCSGTLESTIPPITPAAWTTFMTGVNPGKHGILNFKGFDPVKNGYRLSDSRQLQTRNIYKILSDGGYRVGVVMQPGVHPPFELNGFMLSGFDSPGMTADFAYPRNLEDDIRRLCPEHPKNFNLHRFWRSEKEDPSDAGFERNLKDAAEQMHRVKKLSLDLYARDPVEVLVVYFQAPDVVLHKTWKWCLPGTHPEDQVRRAMVVDFYKEMDRVCGELIDAFPSEDTLRLIVSDHGHQSADWSVFANTILANEGFLTYASGTALIKDGFRRIADLTKGIKRKGLGRPIDWDKTKAFLPYQACSGFVFINLEGRQPFGRVRESEYEKVRDQVMDSLRKLKLPNGEAAFPGVLSGDDFFHDKKKMQMPDIVLLQGRGVDIKRGAGTGSGFRERDGSEGIHHPDGMYIFAGQGVAQRKDVHAQILDLPPTLLAALNQPIPSFMEGLPLRNCFEHALPVTKREWPWEVTTPTESSAYTPEQEAQVEERLADLGYLD